MQALCVEVMGEVWGGLSCKQNGSAVSIAKEVTRDVPANVSCLAFEPVVQGIDQELRQAASLLHKFEIVPTLLMDIGARFLRGREAAEYCVGTVDYLPSPTIKP